MTVLFVYRAYGNNYANSIIDFQRISLQKKGIKLLIFPIKEGGIIGYMKSIWELKFFNKINHVDLIHAHYSFSGFIAGIITNKVVICSLMGSDVFKNLIFLRWLNYFFYKKIWKVTIIKSKEMQSFFPKATMIKNGVELSNFLPLSKTDALKKLGFNALNKNIIFIAQESLSPVKNIQLAYKSISLINDKNIILHIVSNKSFEELPFFYNAADLLLLTSVSEGSPNVIKEAMACNCPIVSTDVGDVREVIGNTEGCYITSFDPADVAEKIKLALEFSGSKGRTNGRQRIIELGLDAESIASKIIEVYKKAINS
jgi:teichuronic acid biosynthesis glycosyltransferase TuaC